jgi:hypothetical protein
MKPHRPSQSLVLTAISALIVAASPASAAVIASESFKTNPSGFPVVGEYTQGSLASGSNTSVVIGNSGFNTTNVWEFGTSLINVLSTTSLTGSVVPGTTLTGSARVGVGNTLARTSQRQLAAAPPVASTYYLSGLVNATGFTASTNNFFATTGFGADGAFNAADISEGIHLGIHTSSTGALSLAAFAGGSTFDLLALSTPALQNDTYQIVLQLDANSAAVDTLTVWYATSNASGLTLALGPTSVETFSGVASLEYFALQSASTTAATASTVAFDEVRFGTTLADVTTVPEPGVAGLVLFGGLIGILSRRHRKMPAQLA